MSIKVKDGETFFVGGIEFIKFPGKDGCTPAVMKNVAFNSEFGDNNNFSESKILKRMNKEILPQLFAAVSEENLCEFKTDLTTLDGLKVYGELSSRISVPTLDFYRENVELFDKHNLGQWWWLSTAESTKPHYDPWYTLCVSPSGDVNGINYNCICGVRPFCIFKSSIFESCVVTDG